MKHQAFCVLLAIGLAVALVSCVEHTTTMVPIDAAFPGAKPSTEPVGLEFDGTIGRIDADNETITVDHWPLSKKFHVPSDCEIDISTNVNVTLAQLKVNDPVTVAYSEIGKELVATRIVRRGKAYNEEQQEKMERLDDMLNPSPNQ